MQKIFIAGVVMTVLCGVAGAATKCMPKQFEVCDAGDGTLEMFGVSDKWMSGWANVCHVDEPYTEEEWLANGVVVKGVFLCAGKGTGTVGEAVDSVWPAESVRSMYCWCKMIQPAISKWVYYGGTSEELPCYAQGCANACRDEFMNNPDFRNAFFSNLDI